MKNTTIATVEFYNNAFAQFIKADKAHTDSTDKTTFDTNASKRIKNYRKVLDLLAKVPSHINLETEITPKGKYNIGTLVECIVKAVADNFEHDTYTKSTHGADIKIGNKNAVIYFIDGLVNGEVAPIVMSHLLQIQRQQTFEVLHPFR